MDLRIDGAVAENPAGGLARYARRFYELLGNRRKSHRMPVSGTILATCKGCAVDTTHTCACVNVSPNGIAIDAPEELAVGSFVTLASQSYGPRRLARVRHCAKGPEGYRVGLQFVEAP
jgi:hypothetical protein